MSVLTSGKSSVRSPNNFISPQMPKLLQVPKLQHPQGLRSNFEIRGVLLVTQYWGGGTKTRFLLGHVPTPPAPWSLFFFVESRKCFTMPQHAVRSNKIMHLIIDSNQSLHIPLLVRPQFKTLRKSTFSLPRLSTSS